MAHSGRFDDSIALMKNAMRLCPYYPAYFLDVLCSCYFLTGQYEEAIAAGQLLLARAEKGEYNPFMAHWVLAEAYVGFGQEDKARQHADAMLQIYPNYILADQRERWFYYKDPAHVDRRIDALRKAGLK